MKTQSVVTLDPIDRKSRKNKGFIGRLVVSRFYRGKPMKKTDSFGHYLFTGRQRSGKTVSAIWYRDKLKSKYEKRGFRVVLYDNMEISHNQVNKYNLPFVISHLKYDPKVVYIILVDEIQSYYYKDTKDKETLALIEALGGQLDQLGKRQIYLLSTAQVYGKVHKILREQCLYMVHCKRSFFRSRCVNDFIDGDDILCDDLGRWSGDPSFILIHGLPETQFDTHRMILS